MMMEEGEKENSAAAAPAPVSNTIEVEAAGKEGRAAGEEGRAAASSAAFAGLGHRRVACLPPLPRTPLAP